MFVISSSNKKEKIIIPTKYILFMNLSPLQPEREVGKTELGFILLKFLIHLYTSLEW